MKLYHKVYTKKTNSLSFSEEKALNTKLSDIDTQLLKDLDKLAKTIYDSVKSEAKQEGEMLPEERLALQT